MKVCNSNHPAEQALTKIDAILQQAGLTMEYRGFGTFRFHDSKNNKTYELIDRENGVGLAQLPRLTDSEVLKVVE